MKNNLKKYTAVSLSHLKVRINEKSPKMFQKHGDFSWHFMINHDIVLNQLADSGRVPQNSRGPEVTLFTHMLPSDETHIDLP